MKYILVGSMKKLNISHGDVGCKYATPASFLLGAFQAGAN